MIVRFGSTNVMSYRSPIVSLPLTNDRACRSHHPPAPHDTLLARRAAGPPGRRAAGPPGPGAAGKALIGQDLTTEGVGGAAVDQDAERVVRALPGTLPSQDLVGGTTGVLVPVPVHDRS